MGSSSKAVIGITLGLVLVIYISSIKILSNQNLIIKSQMVIIDMLKGNG